MPHLYQPGQREQSHQQRLYHRQRLRQHQQLTSIKPVNKNTHVRGSHENRDLRHKSNRRQ